MKPTDPDAGATAAPVSPPAPATNGWCLSDLLGESVTDDFRRALWGTEGHIRRFKSLYFERVTSTGRPDGAKVPLLFLCHLDRATDPYIEDLREWARAAARTPRGSPSPALPPYPSPRETRPRPADAPSFFGDLVALPEWTAPYWDAVIAEFEREVIRCPGFFRTAPRNNRYADALPDEVVRQFLRRHDPSGPYPWLMHFQTLDSFFVWGNPSEHFPDLKIMLIGRALRHRSLSILSEAVIVAMYRIVAHMVSQLMDAYTRAQIRRFENAMEVFCKQTWVSERPSMTAEPPI
jgi:hypothetical protein